MFSQTLGFLDAVCDYNGVIEGLEGGHKYAAVVGQVPVFHPLLLGNQYLLKFMHNIPALRKKNPVLILHQMINDALRTVDTTTKDNNAEDFLAFLRKQNRKDDSKMSERDMTNHMFVNL